MNSALPREITEDELRTYEEDGVVLLKGMFDDDWVALLRELAEQDMSSPGEMKFELAEKGDPGRFYNNTFLWARHEDFRRVIFESPAAEIAARVLRSAKANIVFDQLLIKEPKTRQRTVWHHDLTYWPILGDQVCTLWLALDPATAESGAVEYVKGSHRWGQRFAPVAFRPEIEYGEPLPPVPDIDAQRGELEIVQYELEPGDCTLHHGLTVHGAPGNASQDRRRRAYTMRWAGDDVVYHPRPNIQPMLWEPDIAPGGPLDCDLWPQVWPKPEGGAAPRRRGAQL